MIINKTPLSLAQAKAYAPTTEENTVMHNYLKAFCKLSKEKAESLAEEIKALNNPKIKDELIVKVVDLLPLDSEDVNKIFLESSLSEEEIAAILAAVKKY
ncbi:MAG: hypothetical protein AABY00_03355 [Nanoarchaeota archaeon]